MKESRKIKNIGRTLLIAACVTALLTVSAFAANEVTGGRVFEKISVFVNGVMGSYVANGDGSYTFKGEDGQEIIFTTVDTDKNEVMTEDGEVYYSSSYTFEFDGEEVHSFGIQAEDAPAVNVDP